MFRAKKMFKLFLRASFVNSGVIDSILAIKILDGDKMITKI